MKYKSVAIYSENSGVSNTYGEPRTEDIHDDLSSAYAVCKMLNKYGYGGDRKIYPLKTFVEPIEKINNYG